MAYGSIVENLIKALAKEGKTRLEHMARNSINSGSSISGSTHANAEEEGITGIFKKLFGSKEVTNAVNTAANATNNMTSGQIGSIGAIAGAILGGGSSSIKGALGGGALAMLGTLAINALQNKLNIQPTALASEPLEKILNESQIESMKSEDTEKLMLCAMISAAKADGQLDDQEMDRIMGKVGENGITAEEQNFIRSEINKPLNIQNLVSGIPNPLVAAQVYAVSLFAIDVNTNAERQYLKELAQALGLDTDAVKRIHDMTGTPSA